MAERGLKAIQPRNYVPRTSDGKADKPHPTAFSMLKCRPRPIPSGQEISRSFRPSMDGSISLSSLTSARAVSWVGRLPTTCVPNWLAKPLSRPSNHAAPGPVSFFTVIGAVSMAASSFEASSRKPGSFRACPQRPTPTTTPGQNRPQGDRQPQSA